MTIKTIPSYSVLIAVAGLVCGNLTAADSSGITTVSNIISANKAAWLAPGTSVPAALINPTTKGWADPTNNPTGIEASAFGWLLFTSINQTSGTNDFRRWETWASDSQTFPATGSQPDTWSQIFSANTLTEASSEKSLKTPALIDATGSAANAAGGVTSTPSSYGTVIKNLKEEVRRNQPAFDYILTKAHPDGKTTGLYSLALLDSYATSGGTDLAFPNTSLEIKADYRVITAAEQDDYFTAHVAGDTNTLYGLVAFHVISKITKDWFWATFEHKDNPLYGRQFEPGGKKNNDDFGFPNQGETPSGALKSLLTNAGLTEAFWLNYRMANWQNDFNSPKVASNSIIEANVAKNQASCITCHRNASYSGVTDGKLVKGYIFGTATSNGTNTYHNVKLWNGTTGSLTTKVRNTSDIGTPNTNHIKQIKLDYVWGFIHAK